MHNRFRLEPLRPDQAEAAIREPAMLDDPRLRLGEFKLHARRPTDLILDFLRTKEERGEDVHTPIPSIRRSCRSSASTSSGRSCRTSSRRPDEVAVRDRRRGPRRRQGLDRILGHFYQRTLQTFPAAKQRALRNLFETGLINKAVAG